MLWREDVSFFAHWGLTDVKVEPATTQISTTTTSSQRGFTLLEIMIVLAIMAGGVMIFQSRAFRGENDLRQVSRQMATLSREIRNHSRLNNRTYRLVIDFESRSYWVESSSSRAMPRSEEERELIERNPEENPSRFQTAQEVLRSPRTLPSSVTFLGVETSSTDGPTQAGRAFIYYFPEGMAEEAVIQIQMDGNFTWTLAIHPLTGRAEVYQSELTLRDLYE